MSDTTKKGKSDKMKRTRKDNATLKSHPNSKKICTLKDTYQSKIQVIKHGDTNTSSPTNQDTDHPLSAPNADHTDSTPSQAPNTMPHFIIYDFATDTTILPENVPPHSEGDDDEVYDSDDEDIEHVPPPPQTFTEIDMNVETLEDLIQIGKLYEKPDYHTKKYSVNVEGLHKMIPALEEFKQLVGMEDIKKQVVDQVIYLSGKSNHQRFSSKSACTKEETSTIMKSPERTLLETLITGMSKPKTTCKQYK